MTCPRLESQSVTESRFIPEPADLLGPAQLALCLVISGPERLQGALCQVLACSSSDSPCTPGLCWPPTGLAAAAHSSTNLCQWLQTEFTDGRHWEETREGERENQGLFLLPFWPVRQDQLHSLRGPAPNQQARDVPWRAPSIHPLPL